MHHLCGREDVPNENPAPNENPPHLADNEQPNGRQGGRVGVNGLHILNSVFAKEVTYAVFKAKAKTAAVIAREVAIQVVQNRGPRQPKLLHRNLP
jgi:hypothetical protein